MGVGQKEILWNAAENVGQDDLNNMQRFLRAFTTDWILGSAGAFSGHGEGGGGVTATSFDRSKALFSIGDSCAPYPDTAMVVTNLSGPICQWKTGTTGPLADNGLGGSLPGTWGADPYLLVYWALWGELATTHAAADPTNPRWDLVCIQLSDVSNDAADQETRLQKQVVGSSFIISSAGFIKRRKVTLTKQVVQGTPAGAPAIPAVPAGYLPLYAVLVPALFAGVFPVDDNFHDYRMPMGSFSVDVAAGDMVSATNRWATPFVAQGSGDYSGVQFPAFSAWISFIPRMPLSASSCRLIGVSALSGLNTPQFTVSIGRYNAFGGGSYNQMGGNGNWTLPLLGTGAANTSGINHYKWYNTALPGGAGNNPPTAAVKPPWGTGRPSGYASGAGRSAGVEDAMNQIGIRYLQGGATQAVVCLVRMHFAGMPW